MSRQIIDGLTLEQITAAAELLDRIKTQDGAGSGLDADLLDGDQLVDIASQYYTLHWAGSLNTTGSAFLDANATSNDSIGTGIDTGTDTSRHPTPGYASTLLHLVVRETGEGGTVDQVQIFVNGGSVQTFNISLSGGVFSTTLAINVGADSLLDIFVDTTGDTDMTAYIIGKED